MGRFRPHKGLIKGPGSLCFCFLIPRASLLLFPLGHKRTATIPGIHSVPQSHLKTDTEKGLAVQDMGEGQSQPGHFPLNLITGNHRPNHLEASGRGALSRYLTLVRKRPPRDAVLSQKTDKALRRVWQGGKRKRKGKVCFD